MSYFVVAPIYCAFGVAGILYGLMMIIGGMFCMIPGVIIAFVFALFIYPIIDRNQGILASFGLSRQITSGNWLAPLLYLRVAVDSVNPVVATFRGGCVGSSAPRPIA